MKVCTNAYTVAKKDNYFSVMTNSVEIRILFLTDSILRIRAGFDGDFAEESYSLVMTAWEDRMDDFLKGRRTRVEAADAVLSDGDREAVIEGRILKVVVEKDPFRICVYDKEGTLLHADIVDLAYMEDSNHRRIHTSEISPEDCFYGFGEKSGSFNKAQKFMSMSPKDAMGYNPRETDSLYKHIPFYIKLNRGTRKAVGYFYHNTCECDFDMGREKSNYWKPHSRYRTLTSSSLQAPPCVRSWSAIRISPANQPCFPGMRLDTWDPPCTIRSWIMTAMTLSWISSTPPGKRRYRLTVSSFPPATAPWKRTKASSAASLPGIKSASRTPGNSLLRWKREE